MSNHALIHELCGPYNKDLWKIDSSSYKSKETFVIDNKHKLSVNKYSAIFIHQLLYEDYENLFKHHLPAHPVTVLGLDAVSLKVVKNLFSIFDTTLMKIGVANVSDSVLKYVYEFVCEKARLGTRVTVYCGENVEKYRKKFMSHNDSFPNPNAPKVLLTMGFQRALPLK
jgi:hypothetical protein